MLKVRLHFKVLHQNTEDLIPVNKDSKEEHDLYEKFTFDSEHSYIKYKYPYLNAMQKHSKTKREKNPKTRVF